MSWLSGIGSALSGGFTSTGRSLLTGAVSAKENRQTQRRAMRHQTSEREAAEVYSAKQAAMQRDWAAGESATDRKFQSGEAALSRRFQSDEAGISREFSAKQAQKQMDFQEHMASTQVQRAAEDLQRAGLNRILALGQPAAAPQGAMAQSSTPAGSAASGSRGSGSSASSSGSSAPSGMPSDLASIMNATINMQTAQSLISKQKEEEKLIQAQKERTDAETVKTKAETGFSELKGMPGNFLKEFLGGEGTTGKQVHDAVRPMINRVIGIDRYLQRKANQAGEVTKEGLQRLRKNMAEQRKRQQQERTQ